MGLFNFLDPALDLVFGPLTKIDPFFGLSVITFLVSLIIVLIYRFVTDQERMKELKDRLKKFQAEIKELKDRPEKMMAKQKEMMAINMEMMKHSFKPTFFTFIPIIIIFGWLSANFSYYPAFPGEEVSTSIVLQEDADVKLLVPEGVELVNKTEQTWIIRAEQEGTYELVYDINGQYLQKEFVVSNSREYVQSSKRKKMMFDYVYSSREGFISPNAPVREIKISYRQIKPLGLLGLGWSWLWSYIILSIIFSMALRKVLKVH